jgi:putative FmdB family regulatory protein
MPIYEYECEKCHSRFEVKRNFGEDGSAHCPQCSGKACRIFTSVPVIFKGSGFYVTDNRKSDSVSSDEKKVGNTEPTVSPKPAVTHKKD